MTYEADWESLDTHSCPEWYDDAKIGLFIHWGPTAAEDGGYHETMDPDTFTAEKYDPREWVALAQDSGMRYITFTTKHGGGFARYPSEYTDWSADRDLFGELVDACRESDMRIIAYYCKGDIFLPEDEPDNDFEITDPEAFERVIEEYGMEEVRENWYEYFKNQLRELFERYAPDGLWFDGTMLRYQHTDVREVLAWIYNNYPDVAINDRVGSFTQRKVHGDYFTYERGWIKPQHILPHKWERSTPLGGSWSYDPDLDLDSIETAEEVIWDVVDNVSMGGNYLLNIGPRADGTIPEYYRIRLLDLGRWLDANGEAIYATRPWRWGYFREGDDIRYTMSKDETTVYAIKRGWPEGSLDLEYLHSSVCVVDSVELLATGEKLEWDDGDRGGIEIQTSDQAPNEEPIHAFKFDITREKPS